MPLRPDHADVLRLWVELIAEHQHAPRPNIVAVEVASEALNRHAVAVDALIASGKATGGRPATIVSSSSAQIGLEPADVTLARIADELQRHLEDGVLAADEIAVLETCVDEVERSAAALVDAFTENLSVGRRRQLAKVREALQTTSGGLSLYRPDDGTLGRAGFGWTSRQAWLLAAWRLSELIVDFATNVDGRRPQLPEIDNVLRWHRRIFQDITSPDVGRFATYAPSFTVRTWEPAGPVSVPQIGADPSERTTRLGSVLDPVARLHRQATVTVRDVAHVAADWYVEFLLVHPFADGNQRVGWAGLAAIARSFELGVLAFDLQEHDQALGAAVARQSSQPMTDLLIRLWKPV